MKFNKSLLTLMIALAAGSASAASAGTTANTPIKNTATANFTDPTTNAAGTPAVSNEVTTTVLPITGFDIVYQGGQADGTTASTPATGNPTYDIANAVAGKTVKTTYTVVNNGNIDGYTVKLDADTTGSATNLFNAAGNAYTAGSQNPNVKYYDAVGFTVDANGVPTSAVITSISVDNGKSKDIIQVITIPANAVSGSQYSASPHGLAAAGGSGTGAYLTYDENTNTNTPATTGDLEFTRATVTTPVLKVIPPTVIPGVGGTPPADPTTTGPKLPPGVTTPPTTYSPPANPANPTYPNNPGTVITSNPASNNQDAYPKADADTTNDRVTFVSNIQNNSAAGSPADTIYVLPTKPANAVSFVVLDASGNVLSPDSTGTALTNPNFGRYLLPGGSVAVGGSVEYQLVVTYADSNTAALADIVTPVNIYSGNVPTLAPVTSTFTIHPPFAQFGDSTTAIGAVNTPAPQEFVFPADPNATTPVIPLAAGTNPPVAQTTAATGTDASAVFPMDVVNLGQYQDAFTLSGTVSIPVITAGTGVIANQTVNVRYVDSTGAALTAGTVANTFVTPPIAIGAEIKVFAIVDVPQGAQAGTVLVTQNAVGNYSTIQLDDTNDKVTIQAAKTANTGITVAKYQTAGATAPTGVTAEQGTLTALPGATINYAIIAKNNYNAPVANFILNDSTSTTTGAATNIYGSTGYANFVSAVAKLTAPDGTTVLKNTLGANVVPFYKLNGAGSFTNVAPTSGVTSGIEVAFDTNGDGAITATDVMPPLSVARLDIKVTIK